MVHWPASYLARFQDNFTKEEICEHLRPRYAAMYLLMMWFHRSGAEDQRGKFDKKVLGCNTKTISCLSDRGLRSEVGDLRLEVGDWRLRISERRHVNISTPLTDHVLTGRSESKSKPPNWINSAALIFQRLWFP
jgi:hypothetical protein